MDERERRADLTDDNEKTNISACCYLHSSEEQARQLALI